MEFINITYKNICVKFIARLRLSGICEVTGGLAVMLRRS
jgi:hypothetical protein